MSDKIISALKNIKFFIKAKGLEFDRYGLIQDGMLYVSNGIAQCQTEFDVPFNAVIDLYQLQTLLSAVKGETVIVVKDNEVILQSEDNTYTISTLPIEQFKWVDPTLSTEVYNCENPQVFKQACIIACDYVAPISNDNAINYAIETANIKNSVMSFTDRKNIFQFALDYAMPSMSLPLHSLICISKVIGKNEIVGFNIIGDKLLIKTDKLALYVPVLFDENAMVWCDKYNKLVDDINKEKCIDVTINEHIEEQLKIVTKLSKSKYVFFNNHFCVSEGNKIEYSSFTEQPFSFKINIDNLNNVLSLTRDLQISENNRLIFKNAYARGVINGIGAD